MYYGGHALSQAARTLLLIAEEHVNSRPLKAHAPPQRAVLVDVHTGLGAPGVDTLAVDHVDELPAVETIFPTEFHPPRKKYQQNLKTRAGLKDAMVGQGQGAMSGYDLMVGGVTSGFLKELLPHLQKNRDKFAVTQEFGTVDMIVTGQRVIMENYAHHHGTSPEKRHAGESLRNCFFVNTPSWKFNVARRGVVVIAQAIQFLALGAPPQQLP